MKKDSKTDLKNRNSREKLRVDTVQRVKFRTDSLVQGEGFSQNLSEKGCCLFLDKEIPEGSLIEITFEKLGDNNHDVKIIGRIIWHKDFLFGVKFLSNA